MVYDGQTYYFLKNIFGDVTTIYDADGQIVASYTYDHWGNITSGGNSGVGYENPFRYRGYYYDNETGFYYLQTRYYDPEICRFISADNLELLPELTQAAGQLNLYAYCNNNPIMYTDENGEFVSTILGALFGAIWGGINAAMQGNDVLKGMLVGAVTGAAAGLLVDAGVATMGLSAATTAGVVGYKLLGLGIAVGGGFAVGYEGDKANQTIVEGKSWTEINKKRAVVSGFVTAFTNLLGVGISFAASAGVDAVMPAGLNVFQKMVASLNPIFTPYYSWIAQAILGFGISWFPSLPGFFRR